MPADGVHTTCKRSGTRARCLDLDPRWRLSARCVFDSGSAYAISRFPRRLQHRGRRV